MPSTWSISVRPWPGRVSTGTASTARSCVPGGRSRSIDGVLGEKRTVRRPTGQSLISLTAHRGGRARWWAYDGKKESERPVAAAHFEQVGPLKDGYSFDALHTFPRNRNGGPFGAHRPARGYLPGSGQGPAQRRTTASAAGGLRPDPRSPVGRLLRPEDREGTRQGRDAPGSEYIRIERKIDQKSGNGRHAFQTKLIFMNKPNNYLFNERKRFRLSPRLHEWRREP